ncbi:TetR/AcrR family transcriptional regulator [Denitrobaculum tricleocarpae]|uniref:TetR/AcrR family transcriptional regulator n=1 Tax=Denitrobaculum tricleocarpae TaxID=2591009 RepID=A0A545TP31_9PROT|nr:TetR/AcrR family transcriptional regulator [Denitrobaculum tricleocarpae]TQV78980.1 TetR/AcrR family transcriptional regulator [Denitrobaculum tricleocarpae]
MARAREFEPEEAVAAAMRLFRSKGYNDSSIRDLSDCTGVGPYGLYGVFGSKHGLFLAALDHYRKTVTAEVLQALEAPGPAREVIAEALARVLELMETPDGRVGCLMCNTASELAPQDPEAAAKVKAHLDLLTDAFQKLLLREVKDAKAGKKAARKEAEEAAQFLAATVYGIGLLVRAGQDDAQIGRYIKTALKAVG